MAPTLGRNRRHHRRASLKNRVQFYCNNQLLTGRVADISEGGVGLSGRFRLRRGDLVKLFISLPCALTRNKGKLFMLEGRVVWLGEERIGVSFVEPPLESLLEVRSFVKLAA